MTDEYYRELKAFRYQANLLFVANELEQHGIEVKADPTFPLVLSVRAGQLEKGTEILSTIELDEQPVSENCDGYLQGYTEWVDKQYVTGYFTGGKIPLWMYGKTYSRYFGPIYLAQSAFFFLSILFYAADNWQT